MTTIKYAPQPSITTTMMDFQPFPTATAKQAAEIIAEVTNETKTRLRVSFRYKEKSIGVNVIPEKSKHLKFHTEAALNMSGERNVRSYFVVSKKQNIAALEEHIKNLAEEVFKLQPEEDFAITIWENRTVRELRNNTYHHKNKALQFLQ